MTLTLEEYCAKHNYFVLGRYVTLGETRRNTRATVQHKETGEIFYLYFDPSYRKRSLKRQRADYKLQQKGLGHLVKRPQRGWRNTTLDNRRSRQARHDKIVSRLVSVDVVQ